MSVYEPSLTKRQRRSKAELETVEGTLAEIVAEIEPATVRRYEKSIREWGEGRGSGAW